MLSFEPGFLLGGRSGGLSLLLSLQQLTLSLFTFSPNLSFFQLGKFTFSSETLLISCWNLLISSDTEIVNSSGTLLVFMLCGCRGLDRCLISNEGSSGTSFLLVEPLHWLSCNSICKISYYCFCLYWFIIQTDRVLCKPEQSPGMTE